jgi:hypothetical protein
VDATEVELLVGVAVAPLFGSLGHCTACVGEERVLMVEEDCAGARVDGATTLEGVHGLARPAGMLALMLARHPCISHSALQAR